MPKVKFTIITLFEDAIRPYLEASMMWKATEKGLVEFDFVNLREFGLGPHKSVDDTPYGGGDGMVMRPEPIYAAIEQVKERAKQNGESEPKVILPTPDGMIWTQELARQFAGVSRPDTSVSAVEKSIGGAKVSQDEAAFVFEAELRHYIIFCPHYEGYDARILDIVDYKICLGRYVLTGGELPALIIIDSIVRLIPGVLGGDTSAEIESFSGETGDNIEAPQYTKPQDFRGKIVPEVLLSGDHRKVAEWRKAHERRN